MTMHIPDIHIKSSILDEKKQQLKLINKWIVDKKATEDVSKYIYHATDLETTIDVLEYDIKIALGDNEDEIIYWEEN